MSLEEALKEQADASRELASAMRYYADTLRGVASGQVAGQIAGGASTAADTTEKPAAAKGGRGKKNEEKAAAAEPDPFADEEQQEEAAPELNAESIRALVMKVKDKNKDHALALLKKVGAETVSKIDPKDYQKVVDLAAKVGVTL